jgi:2,3-bisphosphoglycerate-dependent phosphoglycerate mutase
VNPATSTHIILVRHGQTEWNDGARFQGHLDSPLTADGIAQAEAIGRRISKELIAAIYSSDLGRAKHTAELIARETRLPVQEDVRLRERSLGVFQGLNRKEAGERYPADMQRYLSRDPQFIVPNGESVVQHFEKGFAALEEIAARHGGHRVVVVTHGGLVQGLFRYVTGLGFEARRRFAIRNAAYNVFIRSEIGWSLETWGDIAHYPEELLRKDGFHEKFTPEVQ